ncbi:methyltransferase domain-containing protein [Segetibacter sp. 3557_3]|uniref:methyltransferase domain-containing protein n=1 Tax=Segetibacter sp. 3557_3 TaxID=2547429 RepID=UPI00140457DC|nr:methyltransferase domain-containing protein [Segetibacter sp. 3557_3]
MKTNKPIHHYGAEFNTSAADIIVPYITGIFHPTSVVDIGCGIGTWLKVFENNGITDMLGIDGHHVSDSGQLLIPADKFVATDLNTIDHKRFDRKFDLAICLEVAEHLQEAYADNLVNTLCSFSDVMLFSAAIPGQTGENHVNEQYPTYWAKKFLQHNYVFVDLIRPKFWNSPEVEWWYRQNAFVVVKRSVAETFHFTPWDEKVYVIKEMLEMYTSGSVKYINSVPSKTLFNLLVDRLGSKIRRHVKS